MGGSRANVRGTALRRRAHLAPAGTPVRRPWGVVATVAAVLLLAGCVDDAGSDGTVADGGRRSTATVTPSPSPNDSATQEPAVVGPVAPTGQTTVVATGLHAPWSVVRLASGSALVSQRDAGNIVEVVAGGAIREVGVVPGVVSGGEAGLLGLALHDADRPVPWLYAYVSAQNDNRVVRMPLTGGPGSYALGGVQEVLTGIPRAGNHNGGRIAFGPDDLLYVTAGDAGDRDAAQRTDALGGKILRVTATGGVPADNPFPGSPVYSFGHRNPQGLDWDRDGRLWASEFGQDTWDELNLITPGANYGWPIAEGAEGRDGFVDPVAQWSTDEASPSGLSIVDDTIFLAALRGERLWAVTDGVHVPPGSSALVGVVAAAPYLVEEFGRIRDVLAGPPGTVWIVTNNTDGRGSPGPDDDRIIELAVAPIPAR